MMNKEKSLIPAVVNPELAEPQLNVAVYWRRRWIINVKERLLCVGPIEVTGRYQQYILDVYNGAQDNENPFYNQKETINGRDMKGFKRKVRSYISDLSMGTLRRLIWKQSSSTGTGLRKLGQTRHIYGLDQDVETWTGSSDL